MPDFDTLVSTIPRMCTDRHAKMIQGLVRWLRPQVVLEIGSWRGYVTCHIAQAVKENHFGRVYVIDNYTIQDSDPSAIHNSLMICEVADLVGIISGDSQSVPWPAAEMVVVDGDHRLPTVTADVQRAMDGGATCIVMHDTCNNTGPRAWVDAFRESKNPDWDLIEVNFDEGAAILMRRTVKPSARYDGV
jgi:cephalosporin hydroxylase